MKLILSTDALRPPLTGIGWYVHELATRLQKRAAQTATRAQVTVNQLKYCDGKSVVESLAGSADDVHRVRFWPSMPMRSQVTRVVGEWRRHRCSRQLNQLTDWLCHAPNYVLPRTSVPQKNVVTVHDLSVFRYPHLHPPERVAFMQHHLPRSVANAARVIVASQASASEVIEHFGIDESMVRIIPFGVRSVFLTQPDTSPRLPLELRDRPFLLFVNGADPRKNLADTLQAFAKFAQHHVEDDWRLAVTGDQSALADLSKLQNVVRLGYPSDAELAALYRASQGLCYPSRYEGFGLPVIEALASGIPVLTSRTPTLLEFAGLPGVVTPAEDSVEGLLQGMQDLTLASVRQAAMSNQQATQDQFSWDRCVDRTVACYQELA